MSRVGVTKGAMVKAMRAKDKVRKDSLSMLLSVLKNAEISKRSPLTEEEKNAIVKEEIRQCQEISDTAPTGRGDIKEGAASRIAVHKEPAPEDMSVEQVREVTAGVLAELDIETPTPTDKDRIMKVLMPEVKGKADGKVVNETLVAMFG